MAIQTRESQIDGFRTVTIEGESILLTVIPEIGGKIISFQNTVAGREYIWRDPAVTFKMPKYDGWFGDYNINGWDEVFPSITPVDYPEYPWKGVPIPDHGELWCLPWRDEAISNGIKLTVAGVRFPYVFSRELVLNKPGTLTINYRLENLSPFPMKYLWSTHPFFVATPTTRILMPQGVRIRVEMSKGNRLGVLLDEQPWPITVDNAGREFDESIMGPADLGYVDKIFTTRLPAGWGTLYDTETEDFLTFEFSPGDAPFLGLVANRGGHPFEGDPYYQVLLEPCNGCPDRLDIAIMREEYATLPGDGVVEWAIDVMIGRGRPPHGL